MLYINTKLCKCVGGTCILLLPFVVLTFFIKLKGPAIDLPMVPEFLSTALNEQHCKTPLFHG